MSIVRALVVVAAIMGAAGCAGARDDVRRSGSPLAPTGPVDGASIPGTRSAPAAALPPDESSGTRAVAFPPRNEPFDFRTRLEQKYRDDLRRNTVQSYTDIEGAIVWTQEYLRYRLNGCGHFDAVQRTLSQIDGGIVQPGCGSETTNFPPRDQPFDFRVQLEAKYRDGLRRTPSATYVDTEGDIVWTQEYLRYRVSGCYHEEAVQKVFAQIDGRGVQRACAPPVQVINDSVAAGSFQTYSVSPGASASYEFVLTWSDLNVDLDLFLTDPDCRIDSETCRVFAGSVEDAGTLERFTFFMRAGENFRLWVFNWSDRPQPYRLELRAFASSAGSASASSLQVDKLARGPVIGDRSRIKVMVP